jgi:uncharacterized membrane protein
MSSSTARMSRLRTTGLLALCVIPALAGVVRLTELATGAEITPDNARFFESPVPVVLHIVSVIVYTVLGVFQFAPRFRRKRLGWHRTAGRILVPAGLVAALSGLWLTLFFPVPARDEGLVEAFRIVFGLAMTVSIVLGFRAILRRDIGAHRAWMIRGYAIGLGTGTQAVTIAPVTLIAGTPTGLAWALLMGFGWMFNLAFAEWLIRRGTTPPHTPSRNRAGVVPDARVAADRLPYRAT